MSEISRVALFGKLNSLAYKAVEGATVFCKLRGNPYVELEHWVAQILQLQDSDWHRIIRHYGLDEAVLARDLTAALVNYAGRDGYPSYRLQSSVAWERKQWSASISHNYVPAYGSIDLDGYRVDRYHTFGASVSYAFRDVRYLSGTRVTIGVDNAFDAEPPLYYDGVGYDQSMVARPQGRFFYGAVNKRF